LGWFLAKQKLWLPSKTIKKTRQLLKSPKIYKLKKKSISSDFYYAKLDNVDGNIKDTLNLRHLMPMFEPVTGNFTYYQFTSTFKGYSFDGIEKDFHDILIIKTNKANYIIDAYQYTLEWAELPCQYDLYKSTAMDIQLTDNMEIGLLKLTRTYYWNEKDKLSKETGILKLK
jgi:hypothetical protein